MFRLSGFRVVAEAAGAEAAAAVGVDSVVLGEVALAAVIITLNVIPFFFYNFILLYQAVITAATSKKNKG